jgi:hypothetical protein
MCCCRIRDAAKRRPSDPSYDPRSVHIPDDWFKRHKVSDGQQQWWRFKAQNFDSVLLFKMGKFYEVGRGRGWAGCRCKQAAHAWNSHVFGI